MLSKSIEWKGYINPSYLILKYHYCSCFFDFKLESLRIMEYGSIIVDTNRNGADQIISTANMTSTRQNSIHVSSSGTAVNFMNTNSQTWLKNQNQTLNIEDQQDLSNVNVSNIPVIEIATYAETDVYECYIRGFESRIVMRRTNNDWINITQIFKLAAFTKTRRTKVLEKESNHMQHEKVQGGYGRFQGTWIPLDAAKYLVQKYEINDPVVSTIINFQLDPNNPPAKRSKNSVLKRSSPGIKINSPSSYNKTPKKKQLSSQTSGVKKAKKAGSISTTQINPSPLHNVLFQTPQQAHQSNTTNGMNTINDNDTTVESLSTVDDAQIHHHENSNMYVVDLNPTPSAIGYSATQKPLQFFPVPTNLTHPQDISKVNESKKPSEASFMSFMPGNNHNVFPNSERQMIMEAVPHNDNKKPRKPTKRRKKDASSLEINDTITMENSKLMNTITIQNKTQQDFNLIKHHMMGGVNPSQKTVTTGGEHTHSLSWSSGSSNAIISSQENQTPTSSRSTTPNNSQNLKGSNKTLLISEKDYKDLILQALSSEENVESFMSLLSSYIPPPSLDINFEVDDQGHSALHWATSMSNIPLIKLLLNLNVNILKCNKRGFNCISKLIFYNNSFKAGSFHEILSLLKMCLISADDNNRLPLHYLVELSVNKSKDPNVINFYMDTIVKVLAEENHSLLKMCINYQDNMGNTVLHLAALNLNINLCNRLVQLGSSMDIVNFNNETPSFIINKLNILPIQSFSVGTPAENKHRIELQSGFPSPEMHPHQKLHTHLLDNQRSIDNTLLVSEKADGIGNDRNNLSTIMDDISNMEAMLTSSVIKQDEQNHAQALKNSPMLYKSKPSDSAKESDLEKSVMLLDSQLPIVPITTQSAEQPGILRLTSELSKLTEQLSDTINYRSNNLNSTLQGTKNTINTIEKHIDSVSNQKKILLNQLNEHYNIISFEQLHDNAKELSLSLAKRKQSFINKFEKSQSQNLTHLIQQEELNINQKGENLESVSKEELIKMAVELSMLQKNRKNMVQEITNMTATVNTSSKLIKYRLLIGMTIDNINTKLDDIENDLRSNV